MDNTLPTKKSLGQHWLDDQTALQAIVKAGELTAADTVLEIGPGPGALTVLLCRQAAQVVAVEFDDKLAAALPLRVPAANLRVVHQDILSFDFTTLPPDYVVVANIPYYLTSNLIRQLSESPNPPRRAVLLIQKEVAERVAAQPGQMSVLSVTAQFYWQVALDRIVLAGSFTPPPKVDSQVVVLERRLRPLFPGVDPKRFFRLVKAGFSQRRKTLLNSLSAGLHLSREQALAAGDSASVDMHRRAQTLSLEEWYDLYGALPEIAG